MSTSATFKEASVHADVILKNGNIRITLSHHSDKPALLHWGLCRKKGGSWHAPPEEALPEGSALHKATADTPLETGEETVIELNADAGFSHLCFVLYYPAHDRWDNNRGKNYIIELPVSERPSTDSTIRELTVGMTVLEEQSFDLGEGSSLSSAVFEKDDTISIVLACNHPAPLMLHWGITEGRRGQWKAPGNTQWPEGTESFDNHAVRTVFNYDRGMNSLTLSFSRDAAPGGLGFVLFEPGTGKWVKNRGRDFSITILEPEESELTSYIFNEIVQAETGKNSWTLMHRFNLCHDLLDDAGGSREALALLFVWLRFSALRQLTWQRNYNTKPRELSHAQDRLSLRMAGAWAEHPEARVILRLMFTCIGKGGEGQRIRDEILNIMHRHKIKEVSGHFMEEWHQKLHNNTTPDDVVICEAYLDFLKSDGNLNTFYSTLKKNGVTSERLKGFERPIVSEPDFVPHLKDALIHDFNEFQGILRSVHSATDLESAAGSVWGRAGSELDELLSFLQEQRGNPQAPIAPLADAAVHARGIINRIISKEQDAGFIRDLLYLDLALEEFFRMLIERSSDKASDGKESIGLAGFAAENAALSSDDEDFAFSRSWWSKLESFSDLTFKEGALHRWAVLERLSRAVSAEGDLFYSTFQDIANRLGKAINAEPWSINLFTEEVVRGRPAFVVSLLIRRITPSLREIAELGPWQVISNARAQGRVVVVDTLENLSEQKKEQGPLIVIAHKVHGDEEPPPGVRAVITPDTTDIVSHVAVRARNNRILFATCHDPKHIERLIAREGKPVGLSVTTAGDVIIEEGAVAGGAVTFEGARKYQIPSVSESGDIVIGQDKYALDTVGAKAFNLASLRGRLPDWIEMPVSVSLPFGTFEKVLDAPANADIREEYFSLISNPEQESLKDIVQAVMKLNAPQGFTDKLSKEMEDSGLRPPDDWHTGWERIKAVWASKWTPRAFRSRQALGIPHQDLKMAVIIQEAPDPDYAFVLHTVDPRNGNADVVYGELVPGLGETLVGNHPGRAMSFACKKAVPEYEMAFYPSKSVALHSGGGLIFRSSSNGEDLPGFAGAGLYESYLYESPRHVRLDYTEMDILWDPGARKLLLLRLGELGTEIERIMDFPQDIEGIVVNNKLLLVQTRPQAGV